MKIDSELITRLEQLAAIRLAGQSKTRISRQLETIVTYFEVIDRVDTTGLPAQAGPGYDIDAPLRDDRVQPGLDHDEVMGSAPEAADGFFRVPKIIDRE